MLCNDAEMGSIVSFGEQTANYSQVVYVGEEPVSYFDSQSAVSTTLRQPMRG